MQSETGFPSSHQLKSYVASKSRPKLAARAVLSADAGLLVTQFTQPVHVLYNGPPLPPPSEFPLCMGGFWPQSNAWFRCPTQVQNPNGILIISAFFAELMTVTDRQTDRPCYSWCSNRARLHSTAVRPNDSVIIRSWWSVCVCVVLAAANQLQLGEISGLSVSEVDV